MLDERLWHVVRAVAAGLHVSLESSYRLVEVYLNVCQAGVG